MEILNGTDIIEVSRIRASIENNGEKFLKKIYTENEISYCESKKEKKYESYAARFAAKEAIYKAINTKTNRIFNWTDFEIINEECGKPNVFLKIKVEKLERVEISLSHIKEYAIANAVAVFKEK